MSQSLKEKINHLIETGEFLKISNPVRYMGGEFGCVDPDLKQDVYIKAAVCFPDTYEIGMSNMAVKILYEILNSQPGILAERVFLPYPDASVFFAERGIPLYSLESKTPVKEFDFLLITVSSELLYTDILALLESGGIPLHKEDRTENDPIVIIGGPAVTNPAPLARFADYVCIGEFEACYEPYTAVAASPSLSRKERMHFFEESPYYWRPGKRTIRAVVPRLERRSYRYFPVPLIRLSQDHGSVEIMRGCPNGCRFCLAGVYYRPLREKSLYDIIAEIDELVYRFGYREISLASLSSGDYSRIYDLMTILSDRYRDEHVSFSLPSIKVNSFTLDLLEPLSGIKKSGLTLAVETPGDDGQCSVNKNVSREKLFAIIDAAKKRGWKLIKLYFMIGLPYYIDSPNREKKLITDLIRDVSAYSDMAVNVNIGTFIPKPHTPFQYAPQLPYENAKTILKDIKSEFLNDRKIKINYHEPFISYIESILSKGDFSCASILEEAYRKGAVLDAWSEYFNRTAWEEVLANHVADVERILKPSEESFPWNDVSLLISSGYLKEEFLRSRRPVLTEICDKTCTHPCGSCNREVKVDRANDSSVPDKPFPDFLCTQPGWYLICFSRMGTSTYISQKNMIPLMERIFYRAGWKLQFTEGFNRKPKMEFANPLPIGYSSEADYMRIKLYNAEPVETLLKRINAVSVPSLKFLFMEAVPVPEQTRLPSLMGLYSSSEFLITAVSSSKESFSRFTDAVQKESETNRLLTHVEIGDSFLRIRIADVSLKKALPFADDFDGMRITRTETFFRHPESGVEQPFRLYPSFFK